MACGRRVAFLLCALVAACTAQSSTPAWLRNARVNEWIAINNTAGAGGAAIDAYSGWAIDERFSRIWIALAGGHLDSADNRVVSLDLEADAPQWTLRLASSTAYQQNVAYYSDGKPSSRHLYHTLHFVPQVSRLIAVGCRFSYGAAYMFMNMDAFNPDTNTWDPPGTFPNVPSSYGGVRILATGEIWTHGMARWRPSTNNWTFPITSRTNEFVRWPIAHDSLRNQLFTLNWQDGEGYGDKKVHASRIPVNGTAQFTVTFNPSAALTQVTVDEPTYSGMDYDAPMTDSCSTAAKGLALAEST